MKRNYLLVFVCALSVTMFSQTVVQETLEWKKLRIRPNVSMSAPLTKENDITLPVGIGVDAFYDLGKVANLQAGLQMGTFKGISVGGTYHLSDRMVNRATRFIVSQTSRRVYFYKGLSDYRQVFGPAVSIKAGSYSNAGFYGRLDLGIDLQRMSRAFYDGYPSFRNGYSSIKLMATVAKFNQFEYGQTDGLVSRLGVGALASYQIELKPWKRITLFSDLEMGYLAILGVKDYATQYVVMKNSKWNLLLNLKLGISVSL